jgi:hypothetical protein
VRLADSQLPALHARVQQQHHSSAVLNIGRRTSGMVHMASTTALLLLSFLRSTVFRHMILIMVTAQQLLRFGHTTYELMCPVYVTVLESRRGCSDDLQTRCQPPCWHDSTALSIAHTFLPLQALTEHVSCVV